MYHPALRWVGDVAAGTVLWGSLVVASAAAPPLESTGSSAAPAVRLVGVVVEAPASHKSRLSPGAGMALVTVGNDAARVVKTGEVVVPGWTLDAVALESAVLVRADKSERVTIALDQGAVHRPQRTTPPLAAPVQVKPATPTPERPKGPVSTFVAPL